MAEQGKSRDTTVTPLYASESGFITAPGPHAAEAAEAMLAVIGTEGYSALPPPERGPAS